MRIDTDPIRIERIDTGRPFEASIESVYVCDWGIRYIQSLKYKLCSSPYQSDPSVILITTKRSIDFARSLSKKNESANIGN